MTDSISGGVSDAASTAKEQAGGVAGEAKDAGARVASTAKGEAGRVASEAKGQAKKVYAQTKTELTEQAEAQQHRAATGLRSVSDELRSMADGSEQQGLVADLVQQAAERAGSTADWLDNRDPGTLLEDVKDFARRKPGLFIAIAAGAGLVAGRLVKALADSNSEEDDSTASVDTSAATTGGYTDTVAPGFVGGTASSAYTGTSAEYGGGAATGYEPTAGFPETPTTSPVPPPATTTSDTPIADRLSVDRDTEVRP